MDYTSKILGFMFEHYKKNFKFPTYKEIGDAVGLKSKASVNFYMVKLEDSGYVEFYGNGYKLNDECMFTLFREILESEGF